MKRNITFGVYGEYDDYFSMELDEKEYEVIKKFVAEFNLNVENVSIKTLQPED